MQGQKHFTDKVVTRFRLSERVPPHALYRRLSERLDGDFLYQQTRTLYSRTGQLSLDPVVFFKLVLVSRLENIVRDRRLVEHGARRLDIRYLLGYEVDEDLPWHSTISRTRPPYPAAVFEHLFDHVFCPVRGRRAGGRPCASGRLSACQSQCLARSFVRKAAGRGSYANAALDERAGSSPSSCPPGSGYIEPRASVAAGCYAARPVPAQSQALGSTPSAGVAVEQQNALQPHRPRGAHLP